VDFAFSPKVEELQARLRAFMEEHIYPNEPLYWSQIEEDRWRPVPLIEELKPKARAAGLWNLCSCPRTSAAPGSPISNTRRCARSWAAPSWRLKSSTAQRPDTGNMEVLARYGTPEQKERWLVPLLNGEIRSCFAMTEPQVASSDATNIEASIVRDGDEYVLNGHKWWTSGAGDPRCKVAIFMGKTDPAAPRHKQQSMIIAPMDAPGGDQAHADGLRIRSRAARSRRSDLPRCTRAGVEPAARRRTRLRNRAGPSRTRPHPSLHAPHRRGRARARNDVPPREIEDRFRQNHRRAGNDPRRYRPIAY
jgi:alkylation response protein AidB-like acyl-CoA dehydrogenase